MVLVIVFHLGVAGVAIATVISQLVSCDFGAAVSLSIRQQLSASLFQTYLEEKSFKTDFSGGNTGWNSEYSY